MVHNAAVEADNSTSSSGHAKRSSNAFFARASASWTDVLPKTQHVDLFRNCDFSTTPLGALPNWGPALRLHSSMVFADSRPACLYWGHNRIAVYNEGFVPLIAVLHPKLMGMSFADGFPAIADAIGPVFDLAAQTATTVDVDKYLLCVDRNGFLEETYWIGQFIPLRGDSGEIEGFYNTVAEATEPVLHERRRRIVEDIAAIPPCAVEDIFSSVFASLADNPNDITMAMLYRFEELVTPGEANLHLVGDIGIPESHVCAPREAHLETSHAGLVPYFRQVEANRMPLVLSQSDHSLQATGDLFDGITWLGFGEPPRDIVILPLSNGSDLLGFYVQGTNPRRKYDTATEMSIVDMVRQIEAKWASSISTEQSRIREETLKLRALDSENRLHHMAHHAPTGMYQITSDHNIQWANDQFYDITGHDRTTPNMSDFIDVLAPEERPGAVEILDRLLGGAPREERELRLSRSWTPPAGEEEESENSPAWVLMTSFPLLDDGKVKYIMGYITDISYQKWAEAVQSRHAAAATLAKRQQEEFIDTTSHEMRNPLAAILQLADGISTSLQGPLDSIEACRSIIRENVDAADTILACAAHQKRVIDDVLILSRLESQMLSITPVPERPSTVLENTVKMFKGELSLNSIEIETVKDEFEGNLLDDFVLFDTSRLMQVLINLISNAIKFTSLQDVRKISVASGTQKRRPPRIKTKYGELKWVVPRDAQLANPALPTLEEDEDKYYLYFCVQDTGTGITPEEMERLFKRFSQATSRTHITYGGAGLGLYISRELAEKQGGCVGVASRYGEGSAFAFYIETRRVNQGHAQGPSQVVLPLQSAKSQERPSLHKRASSRRAISDNVVSSNTAQPTTRSESLPATAHQHPSRYHVLLVEDNLVNQKVLAKQLRKAECTVTVANNGVEALDFLDKSGHWQRADNERRLSPVNGSQVRPSPLDVILMDWEMPMMNGLVCTKKIRELELEDGRGQLDKRMPIIAITANVREEQTNEAIAAGMDDVMPKPFTVGMLLEKIQDILRPTNGV